MSQIVFVVIVVTTHVIAVPHGFARVVILATQLCMLCDVEICTGVLEPQGVESYHFPVLWLLHQP